MSAEPDDETIEFTDRDRLFVREYLKDLKPEAAALRAGYAATVARTKAYTWVSDSQQNDKPHIRAWIERKLTEREGELAMQADEILLGLSRIARDDDEKTRDRVKAYELLGKGRALWVERRQHEGLENFADALRQGRERAARRGAGGEDEDGTEGS